MTCEELIERLQGLPEWARRGRVVFQWYADAENVGALAVDDTNDFDIVGVEAHPESGSPDVVILGD